MKRIILVLSLWICAGLFLNQEINAEKHQSSLSIPDHRTLHKKITDPYTQQIIDYAYKTWGEDFVLTLEAESWFNPDAISPKNTNWSRDYGLCQLNSNYYSDFINSKAFSNPFSQIDLCRLIYKNWIDRWILHKRMFWYNVRHKVRDRFILWY